MKYLYFIDTSAGSSVYYPVRTTAATQNSRHAYLFEFKRWIPVATRSALLNSAGARRTVALYMRLRYGVEP